MYQHTLAIMICTCYVSTVFQERDSLATAEANSLRGSAYCWYHGAILLSIDLRKHDHESNEINYSYGFRTTLNGGVSCNT